MIKWLLFAGLTVFILSCSANQESAEKPSPKPEDNRMTKVAEPAYAGFLVLKDTLNIFNECGGGTWMVNCDPEMQLYLTTRYQEISKAPEEEIYVEFRGDKTAGTLAVGEMNFGGSLMVKSVIAFREKRDSDCAGN